MLNEKIIKYKVFTLEINTKNTVLKFIWRQNDIMAFFVLIVKSQSVNNWLLLILFPILGILV